MGAHAQAFQFQMGQQSNGAAAVRVPTCKESMIIQDNVSQLRDVSDQYRKAKMDLILQRSGVKGERLTPSKSPMSLKMSRDGSNGGRGGNVVNSSDEEGATDQPILPKKGHIYL